jgi:chitin synthase
MSPPPMSAPLPQVPKRMSSDPPVSGPPLSLRSCGSNPYTASFIDTRNHWPASDVGSFLSDPRAYSNATDMANFQMDNPSVEDSLATLDRAVHAFRLKRYREALKHYLDGGYMLANVAEKQANPKIRNLLTSKGIEILNWCGKLCSWIEGKIAEKIPRPGVHKVGIPVEWNDEWTGNNNPFFLDEEEACRMWYTPVYCRNPMDFSDAGNRLRCVDMNRRPKTMVVITLYNESYKELKQTLHKIGNNLMYLKEKELCGYEKENVWQNVLVCIVADGRESMNEKTLDYLNSIGLFDEDVMTINSAGIDVQCHLFEKTLQLTENGRSLTPLQTVFALKEYKHSKLDSHHWFFNAFAEQIQPDYTILLDVGTMPSKKSFFHFLTTFENNKQIGGVCGQLCVDAPLHQLSNWIVAAQHFEYKISNILDKSLESCFGFISVLPGAFSAYRYKAIRGTPLDAYFQTLYVDLDIIGPFVGNMYLAEDRILCFELIAKKKSQWTMHYVKKAIARTDVPKNLIGLLTQRKRWLNGSLFATFFSLWNWGRIYSESNHSFFRKFCLGIFFFYYLILTGFCWLLPANVYLALYFIIFQGFQQNRWGFFDTSKFDDLFLNSSVYGFHLIYLILILMLIIVGLGNAPKHMKLTYFFVGTIMGFIMLFASIIGIAIFFVHPTIKSILLASLIVGIYFIGAFLHGDLHHILLTFTQYTALIPSFVNIFTVYSFCNLQDLSWGTKGLQNRSPTETFGLTEEENENGDFKDLIAKRKAQHERKKEFEERIDNKKRQFEAFRTNLLLLWVFSNMAVVIGCIYLSSATEYLPILYFFIAGINTIRFGGSIGHLIYMKTASFRRCFINKSETWGGPESSYYNAYDQEQHYADMHHDRLNFNSRLASQFGPSQFQHITYDSRSTNAIPTGTAMVPSIMSASTPAPPLSYTNVRSVNQQQQQTPNAPRTQPKSYGYLSNQSFMSQSTNYDSNSSYA